MGEVSGGMLAAKRSGVTHAGRRMLGEIFVRNPSQTFPAERGGVNVAELRAPGVRKFVWDLQGRDRGFSCPSLVTTIR